MSGFLTGFGIGLMSANYGCYGGFGFGGFGCYGGVPSANYLQSCFCDLDRPSGLNSVLDNGWAVNYPYTRSYGYSSPGYRLGNFGYSSICYGGFYC